MSKKKPTPKHWIFSMYWWNPIFWIALVCGLFYVMFYAGFQFIKETRGMFKEYDLN